MPDAPDKRPAEHRPGPDHASVPRVSWPLLRRQVLDFFQLHSGLPLTLLDLFRRPGAMLREVLFTAARERYTNPVGLMLLSSALVAFLMARMPTMEPDTARTMAGYRTGQAIGARLDSIAAHFRAIDSLKAGRDTTRPVEPVAGADTSAATGADTSAVAGAAAAVTDSAGRGASPEPAAEPETDDAAEKALEEAVTREVQAVYMQLMTRWYNVFMLLGVPMVSLWSWLLFRTERFLFTEHLTLNTYVMAVQNLLFVPLAPFFFRLPWMSVLYMALALVYQLYAYQTLFGGPPGLRGFRGFLASLFGMLTYMLVIGVVFVVLATWLVLRHLPTPA